MSAVDAQKFRAIAESFQQTASFEFMPSAVEFQNPSEELGEESTDPFDAMEDQSDEEETRYG